MTDKRLLAAASLVRSGSPVCDVGTDHGYLAVYLAEQDITRRIVAADVNQGPLEAARKNIAAHGLSGVVRTVLSDGLREIPPEDARDIVICGMGGELIATLVLAADYTRSPEVRLILQPMTQAPFLRETLLKNGFFLLKELPVLDRAHCYSVMLWAYDGVCRECESLFRQVGRVPESGCPEAEGYLRKQLLKMEKIAFGLEVGGRQAEAEDWRVLAQELKKLLKEESDCRL